MKKKLHYFYLLGILSFLIGSSEAQTINVIPNPTAPPIFSWSSSGGALSGYAGTPIQLNNTLVLEYNNSGTSSVTSAIQTTINLAVYNGGDTLHIIPNPDAGAGVYFQSIQLVFNNKLFFIYIDVNNVQRLASFDGTSITLYPNPDASAAGYVGSPRILNNNLYVAYLNASGVTQFGLFNGSGITLIPNPDNSSVGFYNDYSVVFNNKICSRYVSADGTKHLANYDGTSWTVLPNPDNTSRGIIPAFPGLYHNKLYWIYFSAANQYQLAQYDGTNNPTLIANPEDDSPNQGGVSGFPIVCNDTLFWQYADINNVGRLAKFGGTSLTLVPNPDATTYGYWNVPVVYNNNLYIFYLPPNGIHHLAEYEPTTNSLLVYPNPDGGTGYWDQPIVYDNNLYFVYYNASGLSQLGYFNGSTLNLIPNPSGIYNSSNGNNGYVGQPIIWNNLLYLQMASVPYGNAGNLASFDGSTVPINLISFTAQKDGSNSLLQWAAANEVNNAYFSVERSSNGKNFEPIGKVTGHGTVSTQHDYQFTDIAPVTGMNFYRLKQVDLNGNYTYSNVVKVLFQNTLASLRIFPNPAIGKVNISLPSVAGTSVINVFDLAGRKMLEKQIGSNTSSQSLDVSTLAAGVYQVKLIQGTQQQSVKLVKE